MLRGQPPRKSLQLLQRRGGEGGVGGSAMWSGGRRRLALLRRQLRRPHPRPRRRLGALPSKRHVLRLLLRGFEDLQAMGVGVGGP